MKKLLFKKIGFSLSVMALAFLWTACDVGLGEAVDRANSSRCLQRLC